MDRHELALECRRTAEEIFAFAVNRTGSPGVEAQRDRLTAETIALHDEFADRFGDRIQHLIIRLSDAGISVEKLQPLSYTAIRRLGIRAAAETLQWIAAEVER